MASSTTENQRFIENYILIWLDKNLNESSNEHRIFQSLINTIKLYSNPDKLRKFIQSIKDEKLFIIISGSFGEKLVPEFEINPHIYSIYIYCNEREHHEKWTKDYQKVKGVYTNLRSIYDALRRDIRQANSDLISISINSEQFFIYSLLLKEILITNQSNDQLKREFIEYSRFYYADNPTELRLIDEFEKNNSNQISPIVWYTRECFIYSMINRGLRLNDIEILNKISFFIGDLHRQIQDLYIKTTDYQKLIVYYGQGMSNEQFQKLNDLISFNNFLLTTINKEPSINFAKQSINNNPNLISVLFLIEIDRSKSSFPFVVLDELDYYHDTDRHILFSLNPIFRIINIERIEEKFYQINLILIDDKDDKMKNFNDLVQKEFTNSKGFLSLGQMLIKIKQFDKAKDVFQVLLNNTSADNEKQLADIHRNLGYINEKLKDFSTALFHYEAQLKYLPSDHSSISSIYSCIGIIHKNLGHLDQAFEYIICALRNDVHLPKPNAVIVSNHISNIGLIFKEQRKYANALNCFERALKVQQKFLPPLSSIDTFNNIGELYLLIKDYSKAIEYFQEGLKIQQISDSSPSAIVADIHNNLSIAFYNLGQSKDANEHASKAVNIATHLYGEKHDLLKKYQDQYNIVIQKK